MVIVRQEGSDIDTCWTKKEYLRSEISRLTKRCQEVEQWIEEIPDSITRRIFRMYYEDGIGQQAIAKQIHMDQSNVSKRINRYIASKIREVE